MIDTQVPKRGRPTTGKALSPAEKQRRYRLKQASKFSDLADRLDLLSQALSDLTPESVFFVQEQLVSLTASLRSGEPIPGNDMVKFGHYS